MERRPSPAARAMQGLALAALLGLGATAAAAQDATRAGAEAAADPVTHRGSTDSYVVVTDEEPFTFDEDEFKAVPGMVAQVFAQRRSDLLITFSAECAARPDDPKVEAAVRVRVLVAGEVVTGANDLLLCSNKHFYVESHSFQWVQPVAAKRRLEVTVEAAYFPGTAGEGLIADRVLRIDYDSAE